MQMTISPRTPLAVPDENVLASVVSVYERGLTLQALRTAEAFAPLSQWEGAWPCVIAARIAANAGALRLALKLSVRAWHSDRTHPDALAQYGYEVFSRRGPLALWQMLRRWEEQQSASSEQRAELLALKARALTHLRDFTAAHKLLDMAESIRPVRPWIRLQRAHWLESQDRLEEALEMARAASDLHPHPFYRPAVQTCAQLLQMLNRDDEAIELLRAAGAVLENGPVAGQLYSLLSENGRWPEAEETLHQYEALSPLMEPDVRKWLAAQRARAAYHLGRRVDAAEFASGLDDEFHKDFAARLREAAPQRERIQLDVTFVRQHFKTCAPATLAAIGRFWKLPAEHLQVAEAMCYDGTPSCQQRDWAEKNGWHVREFRVTPESALELVERGVPFAISTVEATSAHMMAVIGFDRTRATLLLRDPAQPYVVEVHATAFLERYRAFGPHGMVFIPEKEKRRLDGVALPDAALYDELHQLWLGLDRHDRSRAAEALQRMEGMSPDAALTWEARLELAGYDANTTEQGRCLDKLLEIFPNNPARLLRRLNSLADASRAERLKFLEAPCAAKECDPALFVALARTLQGDARSVKTARHWLRRAMRWRPLDSSAMSASADLLWDDGDLEQATELYWFAASLEGFREHLFQAWFIACRRTRRTEFALSHLQERFRQFGARSEQPALTLAWAWREMDQAGRARDVLLEGIRFRPDDGYLLLRAASVLAGIGETADAAALLARARTKVRENDWLRASAELAENRVDFEAALEQSRALLQREPLALDAHARIVRILAAREGNTAARSWVQNVSATHPHHYGLRRMLVDWAREVPSEWEAAARQLLELQPGDAWAHRELALALARMQRLPEALEEASQSARVEPRNSYSFSILGHVYRELNHVAEARLTYRHAVELSVDNTDAVLALLGLAHSDEQRKAELAFVEGELVRQVVTGDGLLVYLDLASPILEPATLLRSLRQAHSERPDLWHAWSALANQLCYMKELDEALAVATEAGQRFPYIPRTWLDVASIRQCRNEPEQEIAAAERAFELNPGWARAATALSAALERGARLDDARTVYERALRHAPREPQLHALHASLLWRQRQNDRAFAAVEQAIRIAPGYDWPWQLLLEWSTQIGQPDRPASFARALTTERPGDMRGWLMLARVLASPSEFAERLAAVNRAIELDRCSTEAWEMKAQYLTEAESFDEAVVACEEGGRWCHSDVYVLQGRRAWIEAQRRRLPEAVRLMREVLAANTSYVWGWHQLTVWLNELGDFNEAAAGLEQLQRLRPHDPWVSRQLGFARLKQNDHPGAERAFKAALAAAPTDVAAAHNLFDLQLEGNDTGGAVATVSLMQTHQPGASTLAAEIRLRLHERDQAGATALLRELCALPDPDPWPVDAAAEAFDRALCPHRAMKVFKRALKSAQCNPQVGAAAVRTLIADRATLRATWGFLRMKPGEIQRRAAAPLINGLATLKSELPLRWVLWRRRPVLFADDDAWGQVGFALISFNRMKAVARWLADWQRRPNVQPWMLFNLCLGLRHMGKYAEATAVARHVVDTLSHREGSADMRLFLAIEEALAGEPSAAAEHLRHATTRDKVHYDQQMLVIAKALVEFLGAPESARRDSFKTVRTRMAESFGAWRLLHSMRDVRRTFARAGTVFHQGGGGFPAWLWFKWKLHWQWSFLPLAPVALAVAIQPPVLLALLVWQWRRRNR